MEFDFRIYLFYASGIVFFFVVRELLIDEIYSKGYGENNEKFKLSGFLVFLQSLANCLWSVVFPWIELCLCSSPIEIVKEKDTNSKTTKEKSDSRIQTVSLDDDEIEKENPRGETKSEKTGNESSGSTNKNKGWIDLRTIVDFSIPAIAQVLALYAGNKSMEYIDGTTKTVTKSIKPIPIMILGFLFYGRRYHYLRQLVIFIVTLGVIFFMLELSSKKSSSSSSASSSDFSHTSIGLIISCIALFLDGIVGSTQDTIREKYHPSASALMLSTNLWATIISLIPVYLFNEVPTAIKFCTDYPEILWELLFISVTCPLANHFIFLMIHRFGSLQCSIITTVRKLLTVTVNTIWLGRSFTFIQTISVVAVFGGLLADSFLVEREKRNAKLNAKLKKE